MWKKKKIKLKSQKRENKYINSISISVWKYRFELILEILRKKLDMFSPLVAYLFIPLIVIITGNFIINYYTAHDFITNDLSIQQTINLMLDDMYMWTITSTLWIIAVWDRNNQAQLRIIPPGRIV